MTRPLASIVVSAVLPAGVDVGEGLFYDFINVPLGVPRIAHALHVSTDELLGVKPVKTNGVERLSLKLTRRLKGIEQLPPGQQRVLLKTIDQFLKGAGK